MSKRNYESSTDEEEEDSNPTSPKKLLFDRSPTLSEIDEDPNRYLSKNPWEQPKDWRAIRKINQRKRKRPFTRCYRCGSKQHKADNPDCPGRKATCDKCGIKGHYGFVCIESLWGTSDEFRLQEPTSSHYPYENDTSTMPTSSTNNKTIHEFDNLNDGNDDIITNIPNFNLASDQSIASDLEITIGPNLWTFVYKGPPPVFRNYKGDVIIVKHNIPDEHYHFVFTSTSKNRKRCLERICKGGGLIDINQIFSTCQIVKDWHKFAAYLVRKDSFEPMLIGKRLENYYTEMLETTPIERECADFNRIERKTNEKNTYIQRKQRTDYLMDLIKTRDIRHVFQIEDELSPHEILELYNKYGNQYIDAAKICIRCYNAELKREQEVVSFEQWIKKTCHSPCQEPIDFTESDQWFDELLLTNEIDPEDFCNKLSTIMNKKEERLNTFVLKGVSTTGKSLLLKMICANYNFGTVQRSGDHSQFFLQGLLRKTVALMEEPRITALTVDDFKELLGGAEFDVHVKHSDDVRLHRIPVLISTNYDLGRYISSIDREAIYMRCYEFELNKRIGVEIRKPPSVLCTCHFSHWYGRYSNFNKTPTQE